MYEVKFTRGSGLLEQTDTTMELSFVYNVSSNVNVCYNVSVCSLDSSGMRVGGLVSARVGVEREYFFIFIMTLFVVPYFLVIIDVVVSDMDDSAILTILIQVSYVLCDYVPMCSGSLHCKN